MNQSQLKYAQTRATDIYKARKDRLKTKHTVPAISLTDVEKRKALNSRDFKVRSDCNRSSGIYLSDFVTFNAEKEKQFDEEAHDVELKALTSSYNTLMDELVLGDHQEALRLLRSFEVE